MNYMIPCHNCGKLFSQTWDWLVCDKCGFRICTFCIGTHKGQHGSGFKCSRCAFGMMKKERK